MRRHSRNWILQGPGMCQRSLLHGYLPWANEHRRSANWPIPVCSNVSHAPCGRRHAGKKLMGRRRPAVVDQPLFTWTAQNEVVITPTEATCVRTPKCQGRLLRCACLSLRCAIEKRGVDFPWSLAIARQSFEVFGPAITCGAFPNWRDVAACSNWKECVFRLCLQLPRSAPAFCRFGLCVAAVLSRKYPR